MLTYLTSKFEEEYHHLNLWYFVFFFYGIIFYFKSVDLLFDLKLFDKVFFCSVLFSILLFIVVFFAKKKEKLILTFFTSIILSFVLGTGVASFKLNSIHTNPIEKADVLDIEAKISEIKPTINGSQVILTDITRHGISKIKVNFKAKDSEHLAIGDTIKTRVKLFPIGSSLLPGGYDFGIYMYLNEVEASGYALGAPKIITKEQVQDLGYYYTKIQNIRKVIYHKLIEVLGKYEGNFVSAILIGETKAIDPQMAKNMRNSGIAHILSVSGLHLSLVAMIFFIVSRFLLNCSNYLSYKINIKIVAGIISIFGSFGYLLLSGSNIAATRAFIMTLIVILAIIFERSAYPLRSVMIAGMLILLMTPEYIMHPSFQLSFSAVLCLISGYEIYIRNQQIFGNSKGIFGQVKLYVFTNIYSSFLASIVTAPFVIYHFYKFASYSILMNLLAVPLMSFFMMPLAIIALLLMPFGLSELPLEMLGFFVKIVTDSAAWIVTLPYAVINTGYITESSMLLFTFGFFWICLWQTSWRYFGLMIMLGGTIMMYFSPKADFIYDHRTHAISIKNNNNVNMYSKGKISNFTKEYLLTWYGVSESREFIYENGFEDNIFEFPGKFGLLKVSLNYSRCMDADVQIIISSSLVCDNHELVIPYNDVTESGVVLVFCEKNGCYITLGQRPIWKVIKKGL